MNRTRIGVMVGSPGDAAPERAAITDAIGMWNAAHGSARGVILEAVKWETHATPGLEGRPQGMINEELIPLSDCLVAVFHARAGSDTGVEVSGTIEEIKEFQKTGKHVSVYFYTGPVSSIDDIALDQLKTLRVFKGEVQTQGLTGNYASADELKLKLLTALGAIVDKVLPSVNDCPPPTAGQVKAKPAPKRPQRKLPAKTAAGKPPDTKGSTATPAPQVISDSEDWCLLDNRFYRYLSIDRPDDRHFVVKLASKMAEVDAAMEALRPHGYGKSRPFSLAYGNDAYVVRSETLESTHENKKQVWVVTLVKEDVEYGGGQMEMDLNTNGESYSADDLAILRAKRILLGESPPTEQKKLSGDLIGSVNMLEMFIQGYNTPLKVKESPIQVIAGGEPRVDPERFLRLARLMALFFLKAGGVVERVEHLSIGPLTADAVHVKFRGLRRKKYANRAPTVVEVEGDCPLPPPGSRLQGR